MPTWRRLLVSLGIAMAAGAGAGPAVAECTIKDSACYPWRIEAGQSETVLLEVIPNNAITQATYRVCLCPPTRSVSLLFDFKERVLTLGTVPSAETSPVCRDFRVQTARSSRLLLRRSEGGNQPVEGCYVTF